LKQQTLVLMEKQKHRWLEHRSEEQAGPQKQEQPVMLLMHGKYGAGGGQPAFCVEKLAGVDRLAVGCLQAA
jgi:hypothetical protein